MVVLIDNKTASSAETAALVLRKLFGATLVGQRSAGCVEWGNLAPYLMPASGLRIWLPTCHFDWGQPLEFGGLEPDVRAEVNTPATEFLHYFR